MSRSSRQVTRLQFSAKTTIDGNRLDKALGDVVDRYNGIRKRDLARRFIANQVVMGWMPAPTDLQWPPPFVSSYNSNAQYWVGAALPKAGVQNTYRAKGTLWGALAPDPPTTAPTRDQYLWTTAFFCKRPAVLDALSFDLVTDRVFTYGNFAGPTADNVIAVAVQIDNPYAPEDASQSAVVVHKVDFIADAQQFSAVAVPALGAFPDMSPIHPEGLPKGVAIDLQRINIPIPRDSRVRLFLGITHQAHLPGQPDEWAQMVFSSSATLLESVVEV